MKVYAKAEQSLKTEVKLGDFDYCLDQAEAIGGENQGANPMQVLTGALAACKVMQAKAYAKKHGMKLRSAAAEIETEAEELLTEGALTFRVRLKLEGELSEEERAKIHAAAERCFIARLLQTANKVEQTLI